MGHVWSCSVINFICVQLTVQHYILTVCVCSYTCIYIYCIQPHSHYYMLSGACGGTVSLDCWASVRDRESRLSNESMYVLIEVSASAYHVNVEWVHKDVYQLVSSSAGIYCGLEGVPLGDSLPLKELLVVWCPKGGTWCRETGTGGVAVWEGIGGGVSSIVREEGSKESRMSKPQQSFKWSRSQSGDSQDQAKEKLLDKTSKSKDLLPSLARDEQHWIHFFQH